MLVTTLLVASCAITLPYTSLAPVLGFAPLPAGVLWSVLGIVALYVAAAEWAKRLFFKTISLGPK
jgi:Mg2+-importing ATPase